MNLQNLVISLIVGLLFSLSLIGCKQKTVYPDILLRIDSIIAHYPDSALYMLDLLDGFISTQPENVQVFHCLLKAKSKEECNQLHSSESKMRYVVDYYRKNGPSDKLAEAYYLLACVFRDLNDAPLALEYYQNVIDVCANDLCHSLKFRTYNQIGALFTRQGMHFEATDVYRRACFHALKGSDSVIIALCYKDLAENFAMRNKMDSVMKYYEIAGQYDDQGTVRERIKVYIRQQEFDKARKVLNENNDSYSEWGDYYHGINRYDSASIYYQHALDSGKVDGFQLMNIYRRLALYAEGQGQIMKALLYTKIVNGLLDSLNLNRNLEIEDRMWALYSRYEAKSKKESLVHEGKRNENTFLWWIGIIPLVGLIAGLVYRHQKKSTSFSSPIVVFPKLPICQLIKTHAKNPDFKLNDRQWEELSIEMDIAFNAFASRLLEVCPKISDVERHVSYLVKLKISPKNIAHIVVRQKNTISSIRERLYLKIHGVEGTPKQFDDFIENF